MKSVDNGAVPVDAIAMPPVPNIYNDASRTPFGPRKRVQLVVSNHAQELYISRNVLYPICQKLLL